MTDNERVRIQVNYAVGGYAVEWVDASPDPLLLLSLDDVESIWRLS